MEIWTCKRDGSGLNQLTNLGCPLYGECSVLMGCFQVVIPMYLACHLKLRRTFVMRLRYSQPEVQTKGVRMSRGRTVIVLVMLILLAVTLTGAFLTRGVMADLPFLQARKGSWTGAYVPLGIVDQRPWQTAA